MGGEADSSARGTCTCKPLVYFEFMNPQHHNPIESRTPPTLLAASMTALAMATALNSLLPQIGAFNFRWQPKAEEACKSQPGCLSIAYSVRPAVTRDSLRRVLTVTVAKPWTDQQALELARAFRQLTGMRDIDVVVRTSTASPPQPSSTNKRKQQQ